MKYYIKRKYDENKNIIHEIDNNGNIIERKYDEKGNCIYSKEYNEKTGEIECEYISKYDEKGNEIYGKNILRNYQYWKQYDENNNIISSLDELGEGIIYEYDKRGNIIKQYNTDGTLIVRYYNIYDLKDHSDIVIDKDSVKRIYDEKNNLIEQIEISFQESYRYDENGNCVYYENSNGYKHWSEYDKNNNEIYFKDSSGYEWWCTYNNNGDELHCKEIYDDYETETFYEYIG